LKFVITAIFVSILASAADDRITAPIDRNQRIRLTGHVHLAGTDLGELAPDAEISYVAMLLRPAPGLETFLAEQQNPSSPDYHRWLTPDQFANRFGLTASDTGKIADWLRSEGLQVHDVAYGRHWITFSGSSATVSRALRTNFHRYSLNGKIHFANTEDPEVPTAIAGVVAGFIGLDDLDPIPASKRSSLSPGSNVGTAHFIVPDDIATIYDIAPLYKAGIDGSGQKIVVVGRADISLSDIRAFRKRFNLTANDPQSIMVGPDPGANVLGDVEEADLDVEWAGAIAPNATIRYVFAKSVNTAILYAVDQNLGQVLSESFIACELTAQPGFRAIAQQANAQGITWVAAAGDWGAATCDVFAPSQQASKGFTTGFPASLPEVTAIGGTRFNEGTGKYWDTANGPNLGSALSYIPEIVMNESAERHELFAAGGGASALFPKPIWQTGPRVPNDNARDIPDVSMNSSADHDGVEVVSLGSLLAFGGTSVGTPIFAGITALLNQSLLPKVPPPPGPEDVSAPAMPVPGQGNINPTLYRLAQSTTDVFHDITSGDNKVPCVQGSANCVDGLMGYAAAPNYDLATGLGSVDVNHLITEWTTGTASLTTLTATPTKFGLSDKIQLSAMVTGSGKAAPTGIITFIANDVVVGTATLAGGKAAAAADGSIVAGGNGTITAEYGGDGVYNSSGASVNVTLNLPAAGSFVVASVNPNPVARAGPNWPYTLRLDEKAGVATKFTAFTINGTNNLSAFSNTAIPAFGSTLVNLAGNNLTVPLSRVFHFAGADADGRTWSQDLTVPFVGAVGPGLVPSVTMTSVPSTVQANPQADPTCAFSQDLIVEETSGFYHLLAQLNVGSTDISDRVHQIFGTDRLAPFGSLHGTVCWPAGTALQPKNYLLLAVSEINSVSQATANTTLAAAATNPPAASTSPRIVEMLADSVSRTGTGTVNVKFNSGTPQWTATIVPARAAKWLTVSPLSGSGAAQLALLASGTGLSNGVYDATIVIQSTNTVPQSSSVRVVFALGRSLTTTVDAISNAAALNPVAAPGAMVKVTGSNLAPRKLGGTVVLDALPLNLDGVSATVNGIAAPLYSIAPGELILQVPYETGVGAAVLAVNNNGQIAPFVFDVNIAAPELFKTGNGFLVPASTARQGQTISAFVTGDGDVAPFLATGGTPPPGTPLTNLPGPELPVGIKVGDKKAAVTFMGIVPGLVGVTQINFTVPASTPIGVQPVVVVSGGVSSDPASINVIAASAGK